MAHRVIRDSDNGAVAIRAIADIGRCEHWLVSVETAVANLYRGNGAGRANHLRNAAGC
jgi:hypothetical protein